MKKLLTVLFILPLIFSSCEKEEETQSNNNNNSSDVIIGDWEKAIQYNLPSGEGMKLHYTFYYNNTYADYFLTDEDGSIVELMTGTWENLGGGVYYLSAFGGDTITPIFYCDENVLSWAEFDNLPIYWRKNNYDVQSCSEINL